MKIIISSLYAFQIHSSILHRRNQCRYHVNILRARKSQLKSQFRVKPTSNANTAVPNLKKWPMPKVILRCASPASALKNPHRLTSSSLLSHDSVASKEINQTHSHHRQLTKIPNLQLSTGKMEFPRKVQKTRRASLPWDTTAVSFAATAQNNYGMFKSMKISTRVQSPSSVVIAISELAIPADCLSIGEQIHVVAFVQTHANLFKKGLF